MYPLSQNKWNKNITPFLILLPALLFFLFFQVFPSITTLIFSFTDITRTGYKKISFIGIANYLEFFKFSQFREKGIALLNSFVFTLAVTVLQNFFACIFAIILNKNWKGKTFFRGAIFLPVILGITINSLIWQLLFYPFDGPVQLLYQKLFHAKSLFFQSPRLGFALIIFLQIWSYLGYSVVIFLAGLQAIPHELYEAARVDGASNFKQFRFITLPLLAQAITVNILLSIIGALQTFDTIYVTTNGLYETQTMAFYMFNQAFGISGQRGMGRLGYASTIAAILFLITLIIAIFVQKYLRSREVEL
jgi:raffinose/stachyose/melibiose transport system permease protein